MNCYQTKHNIFVNALQYTGDNVDEVRKLLSDSFWIYFDLKLESMDRNLTMNKGDYIIRVGDNAFVCPSGAFNLLFKKLNADQALYIDKALDE